MNKTPVSTWIVPTLSILLLTLGCVSNKDKPDRHATNDQSTMEHLSISMGKPINPPQIPPSKPKPLRPPQQGKVTYYYQSQKKLYKPQPLRQPSIFSYPALVTQLPALVTQYPDGNPVGEEYNHYPETSFRETLGNPLSTFSVDVDTASYSNCRRMLGEGGVPQPDAVRAEEFLNYFDYGFKPPRGDEPISIRYELARCPWNKQNDLLMVGLQTNRPNMAELPPSRLVFLVDTSGSMSPQEKLPLVKRSLRMLTKNLRAQDRVAIVTYAGNAGLALPSTAGTNKAVIMNAIESMDSGGFTAGAEGLKLAYDIATKQMDGKGSNRVILATDGDFNVGPSSEAELVGLIEEKRKTGIFLSVLGFGMGNYKDNKMEQLANNGNGNYAYIDSILEARKTLVNEMGGTLVTVAKDVKVQIEFNPAMVASYRLIGYENRRLKNKDFADDTKDAGEMGAGHSVTALYEIVRADRQDTGEPAKSHLKYQGTQLVDSPEIVTCKLRYKLPDGLKSKLVTISANPEDIRHPAPSQAFNFASAVAEFALILSRSKHAPGADYDRLISRAGKARGRDKDGLRAEFINLARTAKLLDEPG